MIKKFIFSFATLLMLTVSLSAQRVAIVDVNSILEVLPQYVEAQNEIDKISANWRQEMKR